MLDYKKYGINKVLIGYLAIILATIIVSVASVFIFTFFLAPKIGGILSIFFFLIIPIPYILLLIYSYKKAQKIYYKLSKIDQYRFDLVNEILKYIIIMLILFFIFLLFLYFPSEKRGVNETPLNLTIQPYLLNISEIEYGEKNFSKASEIYSRYNVTLNLNPPEKINIDIDEEYKKLIFQQNCSVIDELYNLTNKSDNKTVKLILLDYNESVEGMGFFCEKSDLAIVSLNSSIQGWVLAHEIGHVLGAEITCWKFNLMKEYSNYWCSKSHWITHDFIRDLQPDFLNQKQVDSIIESIKIRF